MNQRERGGGVKVTRETEAGPAIKRAGREREQREQQKTEIMKTMEI